ncbi:high-potential iron-sulfur protein [Rugamonas sp.]|uniref:high-potential iron-sulfur protein n=1 Tax=Rugamonas sp. TaxID=1926287 RepID=UPI0025F1118E|nr:high-potential iron-sulfur protein [Rugamonas sp.]
MQRRTFILTTVAGAAAMTMGAYARAEALTPLKEDDPQAVEFGYKDDTARVDNQRFPEHKPDQKCAKCQIYADGPNDTGGCPIFAGKSVRAGGWCSAFS